MQILKISLKILLFAEHAECGCLYEVITKYGWRLLPDIGTKINGQLPDLKIEILPLPETLEKMPVTSLFLRCFFLNHHLISY